MKKILAFLLVAVLALSIMPLALAAEELVMGSWRNDDAEEVQEMLDKYAEQSGLKVKFSPTQSTQYNPQLRLNLDNKTGPDLFYSRSYKAGKELHEAGFNVDVTDYPGMKENFSAAALEGWMGDDGKMFAVPVAAVSHIVYYNTEIFEKYDLKVPETFEEFIELCEKIKEINKDDPKKAIAPLANGIKSEWDILECVYLGMLPNYVGGADNRALYEKGEKKMNDADFLASLEDFAKLVKYLPNGFEAIGNDDGPGLLVKGKAAMFIDGSWSCGTYKNKFEFDKIGVFAIPAPKGRTPGMCLHADYGIAGNAASKHPEEVKKFLEWVASKEGAAFIAKYTPAGFFPIINGQLEISDPLSQQIYKLNEGKILDSRFIWKTFTAIYNDMRIDLDKICKGEMTAKEAADHFAELQAKVLEQK